MCVRMCGPRRKHSVHMHARANIQHVLTVLYIMHLLECTARVLASSVHSARVLKVRCAGLEVGGEHACAGAELRGEPGAEARVQAREEEEEDHARLGCRE